MKAPKALLALLATAALVAVALVAALIGLRPEHPGEEMSLDAAQRLLLGGTVTQVELLDQDHRLVLHSPAGQAWVAYPAEATVSTRFIDSALKAQVPIEVNQQQAKGLLLLLVQFVLPLLLLASLFGAFMLLSRSGSQVKELFAFSRLRTKIQDEPTATVTFADVAGMPEAIEELAEIRDYLSSPQKFARMGAVPPKGVLLFGPPGCGKTLLARALAGEAGVPFFFLSGSEFVESLVGVGAARMRDLFRQAVERAPAIIFVDELDAAGRRRGAGVGGGNDEREQTLNELLVQMDGFAPSAGVVVIGATNRPDILDPALLRPGRFDRHIMIETPDVRGRAEVLRLHAAGKRLASDIDLDVIARATPGFSGADLAGVTNEAALLAVRRGSSIIEQPDLVEGAQRVLHGPRRRGSVLTEGELRRIAYHEAGHAVVANAVDFPAELGRVSIVSRGRDLGRTASLVSDRQVLTASELKAQATVAMGGCAAETLVFGELSTASESDLEEATDLARSFVGRYGLSDEVGRLRVLAKDTEVFLGRDLMSTHNAAGATLDSVDAAARAFITDAERQALSILKAQRKVLDAVAGALLERESLDQHDLLALLAAKPSRSRS